MGREEGRLRGTDVRRVVEEEAVSDGDPALPVEAGHRVERAVIEGSAFIDLGDRELSVFRCEAGQDGRLGIVVDELASGQYKAGSLDLPDLSAILVDDVEGRFREPLVVFVETLQDLDRHRVLRRKAALDRVQTPLAVRSDGLGVEVVLAPVSQSVEVEVRAKLSAHVRRLDVGRQDRMRRKFRTALERGGAALYEGGDAANSMGRSASRTACHRSRLLRTMIGDLNLCDLRPSVRTAASAATTSDAFATSEENPNGLREFLSSI